MTPQAVLFDCDGVLVESERHTNKLLRDDLVQNGLDMTVDHVTGLFTGGTMESAMQEACRLGADLPPDWVDTFYAKMFVMLNREVQPVSGVARIVDSLFELGVPMAFCSNGPSEKMQITLNRTKLFSKLTPHIYSARDLGAPKLPVYAASAMPPKGRGPSWRRIAMKLRQICFRLAKAWAFDCFNYQTHCEVNCFLCDTAPV